MEQIRSNNAANPGPSGLSDRRNSVPNATPQTEAIAQQARNCAPKVRQDLPTAAGSFQRPNVSPQRLPLFDLPRRFTDVHSLILDSDCPAVPGNNCVGKHGAGGREGVCPLLYRVLHGRRIGRGGTRRTQAESHALMCAHPDATHSGCLGIVPNLPDSVKQSIPLKPTITPEILAALEEQTGRRFDG